jgi:hypothetical protein
LLRGDFGHKGQVIARHVSPAGYTSDDDAGCGSVSKVRGKNKQVKEMVSYT